MTNKPIGGANVLVDLEVGLAPRDLASQMGGAPNQLIVSASREANYCVGIGLGLRSAIPHVRRLDYRSS